MSGPQDPHDVAPDEVALDREERAVEILWSDGRRSRYGFDALRGSCPCAGCRERRGAVADPLRVLGPGERPGSVLVVNVTPVGRYAVNFRFSDGHASGIYTFELLRSLDAGAD